MISRACWICLLALSVTALAWPASAGDPAAVAKDAAKVTLQRYDDAEVVKFPWGWIRWLMNAKVDPKAEMTVGIVHIEPNQSNPYHMHPNSAEYIHVLSGSCEQFADGKWVPMKAGDTMRFAKGVAHMARTGNEPCRAMILYDTGTRQMVVVERNK
ncbi:MAG: cupin domain-containing protein [Verrucomicrobia bacterium]|nr:cupin domain-containing protein [Verrucomicrobiota bacterium]